MKPAHQGWIGRGGVVDEARQTITYLRATRGQSLHAAVMTSTQTPRTILSPRGLWPSGDMVTWCRERDGDRSSVPDTAPALGSSLVAAVGTVTRTQLLPAQQTPRRPIGKNGRTAACKGTNKIGTQAHTSTHSLAQNYTPVHHTGTHRYTGIHRYISLHRSTQIDTEGLHTW
jgi:hypothetical protein